MSAIFKDDLRAGQALEQKFHDLFPHLERLDGRLADFRHPDGRTIELKSDRYPFEKTPNHFMERYSYGEKVGGVFQSESNNIDLFVYWHGTPDTIFVYHTSELAGHLRTVHSDDTLVDVRNVGHVTRGWKIKRQEIKHLNLGVEVLK